MGLKEGFKKRYYLYNKYDEIAFNVVPLNDNVNYVGNMSGIHYRKMKAIKTDKELADFIKANDLVKK